MTWKRQSTSFVSKSRILSFQVKDCVCPSQGFCFSKSRILLAVVGVGWWHVASRHTPWAVKSLDRGQPNPLAKDRLRKVPPTEVSMRCSRSGKPMRPVDQLRNLYSVLEYFFALEYICPGAGGEGPRCPWGGVPQHRLHLARRAAAQAAPVTQGDCPRPSVTLTRPSVIGCTSDVHKCTSDVHKCTSDVHKCTSDVHLCT